VRIVYKLSDPPFNPLISSQHLPETGVSLPLAFSSGVKRGEDKETESAINQNFSEITRRMIGYKLDGACVSMCPEG
jgi:hypothetical protein